MRRCSKVGVAVTVCFAMITKGRTGKAICALAGPVLRNYAISNDKGRRETEHWVEVEVRVNIVPCKYLSVAGQLCYNGRTHDLQGLRRQREHHGMPQHVVAQVLHGAESVIADIVVCCTH